MEVKRIIQDGMHLFSGQAGTAVISLISLMLLARILSTEQMGKYSLILTIVNLALILGLNWSDASVVRHGREEHVKHKKINKSFWARMYIFIPIVITFSAIIILLRQPLANYIGISQTLVIGMASLFVFNGALNAISFIYQSTDQMKKSAYTNLVQKALFLLLILAILFQAASPSLAAVIIFANISYLLAIILNLAIFDYHKLMPYTFNKGYFKKIWAYSWPQLIGFPGIYVLNYIDLFVIKQYGTLQDVGTYSIAYNMFMNITSFIMLIHVIFLPLIVEYRAKKRKDLITDYTKRIPLFVIGWTALAIIGTFISGPVINTLFSEKYAAAVPAFNILLLASIFYFASICLLPIVNAFDLIAYSQAINIVKAGINITLDFILIPKMGIIGAGYATAAAYGTGVLLSAGLIYAKRKKIFGGAKQK